MKHILFFVAFFVAIQSFAHLTYKEKFTVEFDSPQDAQRASAKIAPFPAEGKFAYTTRWDDSNTKHLDTAQMLAKRGLVATCYLNALSPKFNKVVRQMLDEGHCVGAHTKTHPFLPALNANEIFREIADEKILIETTFDTNVVAHALPFFAYRSNLDKNIEHIIGMSMCSAGFLCAPDNTSNTNKEKYALPANKQLYATSLFNADDRKPNESAYKKGLKRAKETSLKRGDRHITLGVHSWQDDINRLGKIIDANMSDEFEFYSENEYCARRYTAENSKVEKISVKENKAEFEVTMPSVAALGHNAAPRVIITPTPKSGVIFELKRPRKFCVPEKIDHIKFADNKGLEFEKSKKFEGFEATVGFNKKELTASFAARFPAGATIENFEATFMLPPAYEIKSWRDAKIGGGRVVGVSLKETDLAKYFEEGITTIYVRLDFVLNGVPARLYLETQDGNAIVKSNCPRDLAKIFTTTEDDETKLAELSKTGLELEKSLGKPLHKQKNFSKYKRSAILIHAYHIPQEANKIAVLEVEAPRDGEFDVAFDARKDVKVFVNQKKQNFKLRDKIMLKKGFNRILLATKSRFSSIEMEISDAGKVLEFSEVK